MRREKTKNWCTVIGKTGEKKRTHVVVIERVRCLKTGGWGVKKLVAWGITVGSLTNRKTSAKKKGNLLPDATNNNVV